MSTWSYALLTQNEKNICPVEAIFKWDDLIDPDFHDVYTSAVHVAYPIPMQADGCYDMQPPKFINKASNKLWRLHAYHISYIASACIGIGYVAQWSDRTSRLRNARLSIQTSSSQVPWHTATPFC